MTDDRDKALLPAGLRDDLPPEAEFEAGVIERLLTSFAAHGYERVKPPLIEFEESLLTGPGAAVAPQMFRLMDPVSQRMMGVRVDMTPQIARIARSRLAQAPRPLRLSYAGQVLRVRGNQLRPERQFAQAGAELIGAPGPGAEAEVVQLAAEALRALGVEGLSIDFCLPRLVPEVCRALGLDDEISARARRALDAKDAAGVAAIGEPAGASAGALLSGLLAAAGPAPAALDALARLDLAAGARAMCAGLADLVERAAAANPELAMTVDPGEFRGFEYQSGVSFALFARGVRGELGRGGRYELDGGEPAVGFTLYLDSLLRALERAAPAPRLYLPFATPAGEGRRLRGEGWRTVQGLEAEADPAAEGRRLGCSHLYAAGAVEELA
jgi:ATP phosphoribosyltransferase regulatory subunit